MATDAPSSHLALKVPGRRRAAWRFLLFILLYVFLLFIFGFGGAALLALLGGDTLSQDVKTILLTVVAGVPAAALATILMVVGVDEIIERPLSYVGLGREPGWLRQLWAGFLLGLAMMLAVILLEWVTGHLWIRPRGVSPAVVAAQVPVFLFIFLAGATHEELLFRGYPFQRLMEVLGTPLTVLVLAAVFGAVHYRNPHSGPVGTINTFLVGIVFALAYLRSGRLWFPIGLHWGWNFFEAAFGLPVSGITIETMPLVAEVGGREIFHGGGYGPEASLLASGVFVAVIAALMPWGRRAGALGSSNEAL